MNTLLIALSLTILISCDSSKKATENTTSKKEEVPLGAGGRN